MSINIKGSHAYLVNALLASERIRSVRQRIASGTYETPEKLDVAAGRMLLKVSYDEAHGFWMGKPWLVIKEDGEPAVAAFETDDEAFAFIDEQEAERWDGMS